MPPNDPTRDAVERRLHAVERALAEDGIDCNDELSDRIDRIEELETRIAELEAAVQALRGYVGTVRAINEDVERRADRAFRKAAAVERNVTPTDNDNSDSDDGSEKAVPFAGLRERL